MACLEIKEAAVNIAKGAASAAKGTYDSSMASLRAIDPANYATRVDFEAAKNSAINSGQSALSGYISEVANVNGVAGAIKPLKASAMDLVAAAKEAANLSLFEIIPFSPALPTQLAAARFAEENLQC